MILADCKPLTEVELKKSNGCGSALLPFRWLRIPFGLFKPCCDRHDRRFAWQEGFDFANDEFLDCMYYAAFHGSPRSRSLKLRVADLAYTLVCSRAGLICYNASKWGA